MVGYNLVVGNVEVEKLAQTGTGAALQNFILLGDVVVAKADSKAHNIGVILYLIRKIAAKKGLYLNAYNILVINT